MTTNNTPNPQTLITQIVDFYRQYLSCSPEQLDLLPLWTLHSHSLPAAPFSPFLNIRARQKQSGKTLCLQLLSLLCEKAWLHTAPTPALLLQQLTSDNDEFNGTLLLDDCHATFGKRLNLKLHGLFTTRFQQGAAIRFASLLGTDTPSTPCRSASLPPLPATNGTKDKPMQAKALAGLLQPFGIRPRNQRTSPDKVIKGYYLEDFQKSWIRHLHQTCGTAALGCDGSAVAAALQQNSDVAKSAQSSNNEASNPARSVVAAKSTGQQIPNLTHGVVAAGLQSLSTVSSSQELGAGSQKPVAADKQKLVAPTSQNPSTSASAQQPEASSEQLTHSAVAADLQNPSTGISGQKLEARSPQLTPANTQTPSGASGQQPAVRNQQPIRSSVAGKVQKPSQHLPARSQHPTRSAVAADLQNPSKGNSGQQLFPG